MTQARVVKFSEIQVGEKAHFEHTITAEEVDAFAVLSGDHSPLHTDEAYAQTTPFRKRVVHGMLLGALVSRLIGMELPGRSALILKEMLEFKKPVHIGDSIRVEGMVTQTSPATQIIDVEIKISLKDIPVVVGSVLVQVRE